jgi:hypothetical protein
MIHTNGLTVHLREAECARAEGIVHRLLGSQRLRDRLVLMIYNEAGPEQTQLSERGIRDALDGLFGEAVPAPDPVNPQQGKGPVPEEKAPLAVQRKSEPDGIPEKVPPAPLKESGKTPRGKLLERITSLLEPFPGPDMFVTMTEYTFAIGRYEATTNRMILLPGSRIPIMPTCRFPHMEETIRHIRGRRGTRKVGNFILEIREELTAISPSFAGTLVAGQPRYSACWRGRDGTKMRIQARNELGAVLENGLRVMFAGEKTHKTSKLEELNHE